MNVIRVREFLVFDDLAVADAHEEHIRVLICLAVFERGEALRLEPHPFALGGDVTDLESDRSIERRLRVARGEDPDRGAEPPPYQPGFFGGASAKWISTPLRASWQFLQMI